MRKLGVICAALGLILVCFPAGAWVIASGPVDDGPEYAPIVERKLEFQEVKFSSVAGSPFSLRDLANQNRLVIVAYFAGWCPGSNRNGHVLKRLYDRYKSKGLGVVAVAEYSSKEEIQTYINRIGADYPILVETTKLDDRKKSTHYKYRDSTGDSRKWGTPFYVIIDQRNLLPSNPGNLLATTVHTVSGELVEEEAERFIREALNVKE